MVLNTDWNEFLRLLESFGVEYLLVGAWARSVYGEPRSTGDIDIWLRTSPENASKMVLVLERFGFSSLGLTDSDFLSADLVIQLGFPPRRIDLLTGVDGLTFDEAWPNRFVAKIDGLEIPTISRQDFIRNKLAAGRPKDIADVDALGPGDD